MKFKSKAIFAGILTLSLIAAPIAAQACGDKSRDDSESNLPEDTETSFTQKDNSFAA